MTDTQPHDPRRPLSHDDVLRSGLDDWRTVVRRLKARFRTGDFATGLALVDRIGAAAEEVDHHPGVTLSYSEVVVTLVSHDVGAITSRDVDLARRISAIAREAGVTADTSGLAEVELALDTGTDDASAGFYAALLDAESRDGEVVDPSGQVPTVWFQTPDGEGPGLPEPAVEQRWHLDVWVPHDEAERRLQAVLDAGGRLVSDAEAPSFWVVEDADGNRSCICTPLDR